MVEFSTPKKANLDLTKLIVSLLIWLKYTHINTFQY